MALKFRVPLIDYKSGKFDRFLYETLDCGRFALNNCSRDFPYSLAICSEERYTGIDDKNGKEVYEGDIVKHFNGVREVRWSYVLLAFDMGLSNVVSDQEYGMCESGDIEVIGNIHENADLLEASNV